MYAFEDHHAHRDGPEDVDGYVTLRKIYWLIAHNIFRLKVNLIQDKYNQIRDISLHLCLINMNNN